MTTAWPSVGYAKLIGTVGAGVLSGMMTGTTFITVPAILAQTSLTPSQLQAQWQRMYDIGKYIVPKLTLVTTAALGYVAYGEHVRALPRSSPWPWGIAACLTFGVLPYTVAIMMPGIRTLESLGGGKAELQSSDPHIRGLIKQWTTLHTIRSFFPTVAFGLATWILVWGRP